MIYRMRIYTLVAEQQDALYHFFRDHMLPIHLRHGARLAGRWETEDGRVVVLWEYDDPSAYERISKAVQGDPAFAAALAHLGALGQLFTGYEDVLMHSRNPLSESEAKGA